LSIQSATLAWSAYDPSFEEGARTGDPLGLRVYLRHLGERISPGLTRATRNVWGFGLLALGLQVAGDSRDAELRFLRWQRLLVLSAAHQEHVYRQKAKWTVGGIDAARRLVQRDGSNVPLDRPLLAHERSSGLWGSYSPAARRYGLVLGRLGRDAVLTGRGGELATRTASALGRRALTLAGAVNPSAKKVDLARQHISLNGVPPQVLEELARSMRVADRHAGARLVGLWGQLGGVPRPHPRHLDPALLLNQDQAAAVRAVVAAADLVEQVEASFRQGDTRALKVGLARHEAFEHARSDGYEPEYGPVAAALAPGQGKALEALWKVHADRHPTIGRWRREEAPPDWEEPDFGLEAPLALYRQGLRL
jgi:hypothetical protein